MFSKLIVSKIWDEITDHMNILSIQSHVAFGHVGNASAVFPLQRMGFEVWPVHTVQFSNHTGYGEWTGQVFSGDHIREIMDGIEKRGILGSCDAILSGYMGESSIGQAILEAVHRVRRKNPQAIYCCDPVMGDIDRGFFVRPGIPEFMLGHAVPTADIITPNLFELQYLCGSDLKTMSEIVEGCSFIHEKGIQVILVTSMVRDETADDTIEMLISTESDKYIVQTPRIPMEVPPNGGGDCVAALYLAHYLKQRDPIKALESAAAGIYSLFKVTAEAKTRELQLIAAQDYFINPVEVFPARRI